MFNLEEMASGKIVLPNSGQLGFRFNPTDEEIVGYFLKNKMLGRDDLVQPITEVDVCKYEPWELPNFSGVVSDDPQWFFFSALDLKYFHGRRSNRATRYGYWKSTGKDRKIKARRTKNLIGTKKTLVFYEGRVPRGVRTNWVMHEYRSVDYDHHGTIYVVCRLMKKDDEKCENDDLDSDLHSVVPELWPEDHGALAFTPPWQEPSTSSELVHPSAHLNPENEFDEDEFVNSLLVNGDESFDQGTVECIDHLGMMSIFQVD